MSFEKIGPYEITRRDRFVAAVVICFVTGSLGLRSWMILLTLAAFVMLGLGAVFRDPVGPVIGIIVLYALFVSPALRSRRDMKEIWLEPSPDGLAVETRMAHVVYKWATIGRVRKVGSRLFVMISSRCALVIPDRTTSAANMTRLQATLAEHRQAKQRV